MKDFHSDAPAIFGGPGRRNLILIGRQQLRQASQFNPAIIKWAEMKKKRRREIAAMAAARHMATTLSHSVGLSLPEQMKIAAETALEVMKEAEKSFENNVYYAVIRGETSARVRVDFESRINEALSASAQQTAEDEA